MEHDGVGVGTNGTSEIALPTFHRFVHRWPYPWHSSSLFTNFFFFLLNKKYINSLALFFFVMVYRWKMGKESVSVCLCLFFRWQTKWKEWDGFLVARVRSNAMARGRRSQLNVHCFWWHQVRLLCLQFRFSVFSKSIIVAPSSCSAFHLYFFGFFFFFFCLHYIYSSWKVIRLEYCNKVMGDN